MMDKNEIFKNRLIRVMTSSTIDEQLSFLKIKEMYGSTDDILAIWTNQYIQNNSLKQPDLIKSERKKCLISFLELALVGEYIEYKSQVIIDFINELSEKAQDDLEEISKIKSFIINGRSRHGSKKVELESLQQYGNKLIDLNLSVGSINAKDFATDLTYKMSVLMKYITTADLIKTSMQSTKKNNLDNRLGTPCERLISDFNLLSYLFPTLLIDDKLDSNRRNQMFKNMIKICTEFKTQRNYHAFFATVAGLNNLAIKKIPNLLKDNPTLEAKLNEYTDIISPYDNFAKYREILKKNESKQMIPYLGIITFDILHSVENELYDLDTNDFNEYTYNKVLSIIDTFETFNTDFKQTNGEIYYHWIHTIPVIYDDDKLYDMAVALHAPPHLSKPTVSRPKIDISFIQKYADESKSHSDSARSIESPSYVDITPTKLHTPAESSPEAPKARLSKDGQTVRRRSNKRKSISKLFASSTHEDSAIKRKSLSRSPSVAVVGLSGSSTGPSSTPTSPSGTPTSPTVSVVPPDPLPASRPSSKDHANSHSHSYDEIRSVEKRPDALDWSVQKVADWLGICGLAEYSETFITEQIDGQSLLELTNDHLKNDLHIPKLGHRLTILRAINELKN